MSFVRRAIPSRRIFTSESFIRKAQPRQRTWNYVSRRSYASGSHDEPKASSDIPWAIGSVAITIPVAGWLWSQGPSADAHGHDDHHEHKEEDKSGDDAEEKGEDEGKEENKEEDSKEDDDGAKDGENEDGKEEGKQEKSSDQDKDSKSDTKDQDKKSDTKDQNKKSDTKDQVKKSDTDAKEDSSDKSDTDSDSGDEAKDTPDTSDDEKDAAESGSEEVGGEPYSGLKPDKSNNQGAAGFKEKVGQTEGEGPKAASGAMHRARSHDDKSLSKKSEGLHDTARLQEPVDPHRPAK